MRIEICIYVDTINFGHLVIQKTVFGKMRNLDTEKIIFAMKTMVALFYKLVVEIFIRQLLQ